MGFAEAKAVAEKNPGTVLTRDSNGDHIVIDRSGTQIYPVERITTESKPRAPEAKKFKVREQIRTAFTAKELAVLEAEGHLLNDLMTKTIKATTLDQKQFIAMCNGEAEPPNELARLWKKLCIEEGFYRATRADHLLQNPGALVANNYQTVVERFRLLAEQGHKGALRWLEKEEIWFSAPSIPPNLNLYRVIFFRATGDDTDLFDSGRVVSGGSPGSGRPNGRRRLSS